MIRLAAVWRWFLSTTVGRWIVGIGAVLLGILALAYTAFLKGKHAQSDEDKAAQAEEQAAFGRLAQQTQTDAAQAAAQVEQQAAKRPPPNPVSANDFDNTGL